MIFFNRKELESFIEEDVPYLDVTTFGMELKGRTSARFYPKKSAAVVSGSEEAAEICRILGLEVSKVRPSGAKAGAGETILETSGEAAGIMRAWKVCQNILEYSCGIATFTSAMKDEAEKFNKNIQILTTRKHMPGTKKLVLKAVVSGGGLPHRLGLSDSALVFAEHIRLCGDPETAFKRLKRRFKEHKIIAEAANPEEALKYAGMGADVVQCERFSFDDLRETVRGVKKEFPDVLISATGGVTLENVGRYAEAGADMIVTSRPYHAAPIDIKVEIIPCGAERESFK